MSFKVLFAVVAAFSFIVSSEGRFTVESRNALGSLANLATTVVESNMPVKWQVDAAEHLTNVFQLYESNAVRAQALSELFAADHGNYTWFVAVNSSYVYRPSGSYYSQLRTTTTTGAIVNVVDFAIFAGNV